MRLRAELTEQVNLAYLRRQDALSGPDDADLVELCVVLHEAEDDDCEVHPAGMGGSNGRLEAVRRGYGHGRALCLRRAELCCASV